MKFINLKFVSFVLSVSILLSSSYIKPNYGVSAEENKGEVSSINNEQTYNFDTTKTSADSRAKGDRFFPYDVHFDFFSANQKVDVMNFNAYVGRDSIIRFTDFYSIKGIADDDYIITAYNMSGKKIFQDGIRKGQYFEYWGKNLFDNLNNANLPIQSYFEITGMENAKARVNGQDIDQKKDYVFQWQGLLETNSGAIKFDYPGVFALGGDNSSLKFSAKHVPSSTISGRIQFDVVSYDKPIFEDTYDISIFDLSGNLKYNKKFASGKSTSAAATFVYELNQLVVNPSDNIVIKSMYSDIKLNDAYIESGMRYDLFISEMRKHEALEDVRTFPYRAQLYISPRDGNSNYFYIDRTKEGKLKLSRRYKFDGTVSDDIEYTVLRADKSVKLSVLIPTGSDAYTEYERLFKEFNAADVEVGDGLIIKANPNRYSLDLNLLPINPYELLIFQDNGILIEKTSFQEYSTKISFDKSVVFNANVDKNKNVSLVGPFFDSSFYRTFLDDYSIEVYDKNDNLKFSQNIKRGQSIDVVSRDMIAKFNNSNITIGDFLMVNLGNNSKIYINGKLMDKSKKYVFGNVGTYPVPR